MKNGQQQRRGAAVYNALKTRPPGDQMLAGINGAWDSLPFGLGNGSVAAIRATGDALNGADFRRAWQARLAAEQAQDRYDAAHVSTARALGQAAGTATQLALYGELEAPALVAGRIAEHAPLIGREIAALAAGGAGSGIVGQGLTDFVRGRRASLTDYLGAALGGAAGGVTALSGSGRAAGAVDGATTAAAQRLLRGQAPSYEDVMRGAIDGGLVGAATGGVGRRVSNSASSLQKGQIGEAASGIRSAVRGVRVEPGRNRTYRLDSGGYTRPDHFVIEDGRVVGLTEAKFGLENRRLSKRQQQAKAQLGDRYRVDHFLPQDIGAPVGSLGATVGRSYSDDQD